MSAKSFQLPGDVDASKKIHVYNRTGTATVKGKVYVRDFKASASESTTERLARGGVVAATANNLDMPPVVANSVAADNEIFEGICEGPADAYVAGTCTAGTYLKTSASGLYLVPAAFGSSSTDVAWAIATEESTDGGTGTARIGVELLGRPYSGRLA